MCFTKKQMSASQSRDSLGASPDIDYQGILTTTTTTTTTISMSSRPLPPLPTIHYDYPPRPNDHYPFSSPYYGPQDLPDLYEEPVTSSFPVGTILHKGFYDLLSMIPTPSPSRFLSAWRASPGPPPSNHDSVAGPRYEELGTARIRSMPKKGRKVTKDMVSKPTGFV